MKYWAYFGAKLVAIVGLLLVFGGNGAVVWAERTIPSGLTALIIALVPLWMALLDRLNQAGHTIVVITHDMQLVAEHARRVVVMAEGQIIADGPPAAVFADSEVTARAHIEPPEVTRLALELARVPALSVPELATLLGARPNESALPGFPSPPQGRGEGEGGF